MPLTLNFRQIGVCKLRNYLEQKDFEEYLSGQNLTYEDDLRAKLIESDFEWRPDTGHTGHKVATDDYSAFILLAIFLVMILVKFGLFALGNWHNSLTEPLCLP